MDRGMSASPSSFREFCSPLAPAPYLAAFPRALEPPSEPPPALRTPPSEESPPVSGVFRIGTDSPDDVLALAACAGHPRAPTIITMHNPARVRGMRQRRVGPTCLGDHLQ